MNDTIETGFGPTFYHDGCSTCLQIADIFGRLMPGLAIVDLSKDAARIAEAEMLGVSVLPCLVADGEVLPVSQHSMLSELAEGAH
ncbi:hypothetical protein B0920_09235 [Massilia sp. KIM]|uniref:hypothetical protein n=1 Tax=Massilia sp. KIM TaxID=1955422 RepID=UPI00098EF3B9|nr:hypothetical protein [Massilia sp. KIM]OON63526.1 hypothetical protein B0920_09235 [Massilia sp. KIM]